MKVVRERDVGRPEATVGSGVLSSGALRSVLNPCRSSGHPTPPHPTPVYLPPPHVTSLPRRTWFPTPVCSFPSRRTWCVQPRVFTPAQVCSPPPHLT